jgi:hypothetical protein
LSHSLGEEEAADFILTEVTKPLLQQAMSVEVGNGTKTPWGEPGETSSLSKPFMGENKSLSAAAGRSESASRVATVRSTPVVKKRKA